jgi:hypothetical protein
MFNYLITQLPIKSEITNWFWHAIYITSGGEDDIGCKLQAAWGYRRWTISLPNILKPHKELHLFNRPWEDNTIGHYIELVPIEYGVSYIEEFISFRYGKVTHDSSTDEHKFFLIPWLDKRCVRTTIINPLDGSIHHPNIWPITGTDRWEEQQAIESSCPKFEFAVMHKDGQVVKGRLHLEEWEWRQGSGWFKWLEYITKPFIITRIDVDFDDEVGPGRSSWKGGTLAFTSNIDSGETYINTLERFCADNNLILLLDVEVTGAQGLEP